MFSGIIFSRGHGGYSTGGARITTVPFMVSWGIGCGVGGGLERSSRVRRRVKVTSFSPEAGPSITRNDMTKAVPLPEKGPSGGRVV